jgi:acetolactate synthase-1/2/3 large subunit
MTGQEMATARQFGANIVAIVYNNEGYNSIRMHQEAQYPDRQYGTALVNPDFAALGAAYGALGLKVSRDEEFLGVQEGDGRESVRADEVMTDFEPSPIRLPVGGQAGGLNVAGGSMFKVQRSTSSLPHFEL